MMKRRTPLVAVNRWGWAEKVALSFFATGASVWILVTFFVIEIEFVGGDDDDDDDGGDGDGSMIITVFAFSSDYLDRSFRGYLLLSH